MAGVLIHEVSGYSGSAYNLKIPSLTDPANIQEAMMLFHYGVDSYDGSIEPADASVFGNLRDFDNRIAELEANEVVQLDGTENEIVSSGSVGFVTLSLPEELIAPGSLETTTNLLVGGSASFTGDVSLSANQIVSGSASILGDLSSGGITSLNGNATVGGTLIVTDNSTHNSDVFLGSSSANFVTVAGSASIPILSATTASVTTDYVTTSNIVTANITTANITTSNVTGTATFAEITEVSNDLSLVSNSASPNFDNGEIFYIASAPGANFSLDFQNVPTSDDRVSTFTFFVTQGSTGYYPSSVLIGGVSQTIKWVGGSAPTPTNGAGKIDIFSFTLIRRSSTWLVLGNANLGF